MPALNFQSQFAEAVERGEKRQTIRAPRKDGRDPKPGETLHLYTGMRTKACRKLCERRCTSVTPVVIDYNSVQLNGGTYLLTAARENFARADGFADWTAMRQWFERTHGLPFFGFAISWDAPQ